MSKWDYSHVDHPTIYVDVDGTLLIWQSRMGVGNPEPNSALLAHLTRKRAAGTQIYLWSRGGAEHARMAAQYCQAEHLFDGFLQKPQEMFDDSYGWLDAVERHGIGRLCKNA